MDTTLHRAASLSSRKPVCMAAKGHETSSAWRNEWTSTDVGRRCLTAVSPILLALTSLDDSEVRWTGFGRGQGRCQVNLVRWGQAPDPNCSCGAAETISHIVNECPQTRLNGGLEILRQAEDDAVQWLGMQCKHANADKNTLEESREVELQCFSPCFQIFYFYQYLVYIFKYHYYNVF